MDIRFSSCFSPPSSSWFPQFLLSSLFVLTLVTSCGGHSPDDSSCDPRFRQAVERCLTSLRGFPILTRNRTLLAGDWDLTDVICKWKLVYSASLCLSSVYASCPQAKTFRSLCGFQSLDPPLLLQYGGTICKHKDVLRKFSNCLIAVRCKLESCLAKFDPIVPSRLSSGLWKSPQNSPQCSYHAYAEHCHEKTVPYTCGLHLYDVQMDLLHVTRPPQCSPATVKALKRRFRKSDIYVVFNSAGASHWLARRPVHVTNALIGVLAAVVLSSGGLLGVR